MYNKNLTKAFSLLAYAVVFCVPRIFWFIFLFIRNCSKWLPYFARHFSLFGVASDLFNPLAAILKLIFKGNIITTVRVIKYFCIFCKTLIYLQNKWSFFFYETLFLEKHIIKKDLNLSSSPSSIHCFSQSTKHPTNTM